MAEGEEVIRPHRLLVIDDEAIVGQRLSQILTKLGFSVAAHVDPRAALAAAEKEPFDVVVTDLKMPGIDGFEVLRRIKRLSPATRVVIITGYAEMISADAASREGAFAFIAKPFRLEEIKKAILLAVREPGGVA